MTTTEVSVKVCSTCRQTKPLIDFHKNHTKRDGYNHLCRPCMKAVAKRWRDAPEGRAKSLWTSAKNRAEKKVLDFDLTPEWILARLAVGQCEVTGIPLELSGTDDRGFGYFRPWTPSLDRTDPNKGYTQDNVKVVCWIYNAAKGVGTHEDVVLFSQALIAANDN
jgi:hypothetical protein